MTDDPTATSWTRGETAALDVPGGHRASGLPLVDGAAQVEPASSSVDPSVDPAVASVDPAGALADPAVASVDPAGRGHPSSLYFAEHRRSPALGVLSLAAAVVAIVVQAIAIVNASSGAYLLGTTLAIVAIGLSALAVLVGLIALIAGRGRWMGFAGAGVGLLTNPLVLVAVLGFFGGA